VLQAIFAYVVNNTYLFPVLPFFLNKKTALHIGIYVDINRGHPDGFKADNAAPIRVPLLIGNIKMFTGKTIDMLCFLSVVFGHKTCSKI
jgi:hypothetical protein